MEQIFIGRFRIITPLIIVPIDQECTRAHAADAYGRRLGAAFSECPFRANFVSNKWNVFGIYGAFTGHGRM